MHRAKFTFVAIALGSEVCMLHDDDVDYMDRERERDRSKKDAKYITDK